jgi:hypothetical protein
MHAAVHCLFHLVVTALQLVVPEVLSPSVRPHVQRLTTHQAYKASVQLATGAACCWMVLQATQMLTSGPRPVLLEPEPAVVTCQQLLLVLCPQQQPHQAAALVPAG